MVVLVLVCSVVSDPGSLIVTALPYFMMRVTISSSTSFMASLARILRMLLPGFASPLTKIRSPTSLTPSGRPSTS